MNYLLSLALLTAAIGASAQDLTRDLEPFTGLAVNSGIQATVEQADRHRLVVTGDPEALAALEIEQEDGHLGLGFEDERWDRLTAEQRRSVRATVYVEALERVVVNGGAAIRSAHTWRSGFFRAVANGGGELELRVEASDGVKVVANGGSEVHLAGATDELDVQGNGSAVVDASGLASRRAKVMSNGGSEVSVSADERLKVMANGGSEVSYTGAVPDAQVVSIGGSKVSRG